MAPGERVPEISIVVCTRNRVARLRQALAHWRQIETRHAWELVIVDNGSADGTREEVLKAAAELPFLRCVAEPRIGLGAARDRGWREARGAIIAFTDDDCYPLPDYIDRLHEVFHEQPGPAFIGARIELWDPEDWPITIDTRQAPEPIPPRCFVPSGAIQGANMAFRRDTLERVGGFDHRLGAGTRFPCEDIDCVAAAVWAGFEGRYDPRPAVRHHHGRRSRSAARRLAIGYHKGRGAYYAKYIMNRDSRGEYVLGWLRSIRLRRRGDFLRLVLEVVYAAMFVAQYGRMGRNPGRGAPGDRPRAAAMAGGAADAPLRHGWSAGRAGRAGPSPPEEPR